ncbi:MAG: hypothetical protein LBV12_10905, partial [Puniceicoccales bacterium]|nr:hypothetical protein [Puniceicoccales bacterium]
MLGIHLGHKKPFVRSETKMLTIVSSYLWDNANRNVEVPGICPFCNNGISPALVSRSSSANQYYAFVFKCTHPDCLKHFVCLLKSDDSTRNFSLIYCHPKESGKRPEKVLSDLSVRFDTLYRQAQAAELIGDYDLASCGYRNA